MSKLWKRLFGKQTILSASGNQQAGTIEPEDAVSQAVLSTEGVQRDTFTNNLESGQPLPMRPTPSDQATSLLLGHRLKEFASYGPNGVALVLSTVEQFIAAGSIGEARDALKNITGSLDFEPLSSAVMPEIATRVRGYLKSCPIEAANLLGALRDKESIGVLEPMLSTDDWSKRVEIGKVLRKLDYGNTVSEITRLLFAEEMPIYSPDGLSQKVIELKDGFDEQLEIQLIALADHNRSLARRKFWALGRIGHLRTIEYLKGIVRRNLFADIAADALTRVVCHRLSSLDEQVLKSLQHFENGICLEPYDHGPFGKEPVSTAFVRRLANLELQRRHASIGSRPM